MASMKITCQGLQENYKAYKMFGHRKSMIVRYEDLAYFPLDFAKKLHASASKLEIHEDLLSWIEENTHSQSKDPYGTQRDSSKTAEHWRELSSYYIDSHMLQDVLQVQDYCSQMMEIYGYHKIKS